MQNINTTDGRWPVEFLKNQAKVLAEEWQNCENIKKRNAENLREVSQGDFSLDEAGRSQALMEQHVNSINLECSSKKLLSIQEALRRIRMDIRKLKATHTYGVCVYCENFISSARLISIPWVQECKKCKEIQEKFKEENGKTKQRSLKISYRR